jgi:hypothetical protein
MDIEFAERFSSHVRLAMLASLLEDPVEERLRTAVMYILARAPGRAANVSLITEILPDYGFDVSRDQVTAALAWAGRAGLAVEQHQGGVTGGMLTDLGVEIAEGRTSVPGATPAATNSMLQDKLSALSLSVHLDDLISHIGWLVEKGLVRRIGAAVAVTASGRDVALGRRQVEGIKAPSSSTIMRMAAAGAVATLRQS